MPRILTPKVTVLNGDCREVLKTLPDGSVQAPQNGSAIGEYPALILLSNGGLPGIDEYNSQGGIDPGPDKAFLLEILQFRDVTITRPTNEKLILITIMHIVH